MKLISKSQIEEIERRWLDFSENDIQFVRELPNQQQIVEDIKTLLAYLEEFAVTDEQMEEIEDSHYKKGYKDGFWAAEEKAKQEYE